MSQDVIKIVIFDTEVLLQLFQEFILEGYVKVNKKLILRYGYILRVIELYYMEWSLENVQELMLN